MEVNVIMVILVLGAGLWNMETEAVTGEEGGAIEIECSHSNAFTNDKYFCKEPCTNEDVLIHTSEKLSNGKYSIRDEGNTFYVTISELTIDDSGVYWCGIDRVGLDTFKQVDITVIERTTTQENSSEAFGSSTSSSKKLLYIGASLGVVVLGLVIVLIIFIKHRDRDSKSTGQDHNLVCARPLKQRQHAPPDTSTSTANENLERDGKMTTISEGDVFYSSVSFNKHSDHSTAITTHTPTATYSVIKHKPIDETAVYCNV